MDAKLTTQAVRDLIQKCLSNEPERIEVNGIVSNFSFSKVKLEEHRGEILELLLELPEPFQVSKGGGWSFLQACFDKHGNHWAEHPTMDALFCLGQGAGLVDYLLPRKDWVLFPGGMPYLYIKDSHEDPQQVS